MIPLFHTHLAIIYTHQLTNSTQNTPSFSQKSYFPRRDIHFPRKLRSTTIISRSYDTSCFDTTTANEFAAYIKLSRRRPISFFVGKATRCVMCVKRNGCVCLRSGVGTRLLTLQRRVSIREQQFIGFSTLERQQRHSTRSVERAYITEE